MGVFLLILQIIGIILAVIAAFIVFAIVTPLTYRAQGGFHGKPEGEVRAGWLLNLVRVFAEFRNGKPKVQVKVLFFTVFDSTRKKKRKRSKVKQRKASVSTTPNAESYASTGPGDRVDDEFFIDEDIMDDIPDDEGGKKGIFAKIKGIFEKIVNFLKGAKEKAESVLVWLDPEHRRLIGFLWENGIKILKKVKPKKFSLKGTGGTGDPYSTGMILSWSGLAVGMLGIPGVEFEPDYENKRLDIDAEASGYFFVLPVALLAFKIYRNKDFKRFILKKNIPVEE